MASTFQANVGIIGNKKTHCIFITFQFKIKKINKMRVAHFQLKIH